MKIPSLTLTQSHYCTITESNQFKQNCMGLLAKKDFKELFQTIGKSIIKENAKTILTCDSVISCPIHEILRSLLVIKDFESIKELANRCLNLGLDNDYFHGYLTIATFRIGESFPSTALENYEETLNFLENEEKKIFPLRKTILDVIDTMIRWKKALNVSMSNEK